MNKLRFVKILELKLRNSPRLHKFGKRAILLTSSDTLYNGKELLDDYITSGRVFHFKQLGPENNDTPIYHISFGVYNMETCGFFGMLNTCLRYLYCADFYGFTPAIEWKNTIYSEPDGFNDTSNTFEYYFEPVSTINSESICNSAYVCPALYGDSQLLSISTGEDSEIEILSSLYKKYIRIRQDIRIMIDQDINTLGIGQNCLGVQIRGTDAKDELYGHLKYIEESQYYDAIDDILDQYDCIFLATEDIDIYDSFLNRYGKKVLTYTDVARSRKCTIDVSKEVSCSGDRFKLGYEVLRDSITLEKCDGLVCGPYNVPLFSRIVKKSNCKEYKHCIVINNGTSIKNHFYTKDLI